MLNLVHRGPSGLPRRGRSCRNTDTLENELRVREMKYREAVDELKKAEFNNEALQREVAALRGGSKISPEEAARTFGLSALL